MPKPSTWRPTLRFTLSTFLFIIFLVTGATVVSLGYFTSRDALVTFSDGLMERVADSTHGQLDVFLAPTERSVLLARKLVRAGIVDVEDIDGLEAFFFHTMKANPTVVMLNYGDEQGNYLMVKRNPEGSLDTKIIRRSFEPESGRELIDVRWRVRRPGDPVGKYETRIDEKDRYDPRVRPWYRYWTEEVTRDDPKSEGKEGEIGVQRYRVAADRLHWTDVYIFHTDQVPGITASIPLLDDHGGLLGVLHGDVGLMELSSFLADLNISPRGKAFIVDYRKRLVAVPDPEKLLGTTGEGDGSSLNPVKESPFPEISSLSTQEGFKRAFSRDTGTQFFSFSHEGEHYFARLVRVEHPAGQGWIIGVVIPESDVLGSVKRAMMVTLLIIGAVMIVGMILVLGVSRFVSASMSKLVRETDRVRNLELAPSGEAVSRFWEVHEVLTAFERMKTGLRSFQKYVPLQLVRMLLRREIEPKLGGSERDLTIFFSDIKDFTAIGEQLGPQKLAEKLARYLTAMTRCIQAPGSEGTVDKYIGDAVVAFWNAPEDVSDHAYKACKAALEGLRRIDEIRLEDDEFPDFFTRIAIHTGRVIVGHFGSEEHIAYTCIGDDVNLASRLEGLNKIYGTKIIITQAVLDRTGERFGARRLDRVVVKGKSRPVTIYELIGEKENLPEDLVRSVELYEQGFALYLERKWSDAADAFEKSLEIKPEDKAAAVMIERCRTFDSSPPPADWQGVHSYETK